MQFRFTKIKKIEQEVCVMQNKLRISSIILLGIIMFFSVPASAKQAKIYSNGDLREIKTKICMHQKSQLDELAKSLKQQLGAHQRWDNRTKYIHKDIVDQVERQHKVCLKRVSYAVQ